MFKKVLIFKNMFYSLLRHLSLLALSVSCSYVLAEPLAQNMGWDGDLSFIAIGYSQQSQFAVEDNNRLTADLNNTGKTSNRFGALPMIRLDYTLKDLQTKIFLGNSQDNLPKGQFALEFGLTQSLGYTNQLTIAVLPTLSALEETWQDPFLTGRKRQKTNEEIGGGRVKFEHQGDNAFDVQYAFLRSELDIEHSGNALTQLTRQQRDMLNRNANFHHFNLNLHCPINPSFILRPSFQINSSDAQGDANDFAEGVFKLQSLYIKEKHVFSATFGIGRKESSVDNPIFKLPQNDKSLSLDVFYKYAEPLGYKNWSLLGAAIWKQSDSNITFYNSQSSVLGVGLGYTW